MILDTNALSAFADGDQDIGAILRRQPRVAVPVVVLGEYRYGISRSRKMREYEAWIEAELSDFDILPITSDTTIPYAAIRRALKEQGKPIPANDVWIAALALQHRLPVLSRDQHFDAVPDLTRQDW